MLFNYWCYNTLCPPWSQRAILFILFSDPLWTTSTITAHIISSVTSADNLWWGVCHKSPHILWQARSCSQTFHPLCGGPKGTDLFIYSASLVGKEQRGVRSSQFYFKSQKSQRPSTWIRKKLLKNPLTRKKRNVCMQANTQYCRTQNGIRGKKKKMRSLLLIKPFDFLTRNVNNPSPLGPLGKVTHSERPYVDQTDHIHTHT